MSTGIGKRIKDRRNELGLSQDDLAKKLGLKSKSTVCKVETGDDNLSTTTVTKYAQALSCSEAFLMGWEDAFGNPMERAYSVGKEDYKFLLRYKNSDDDIKSTINRLLAYQQKFKELKDEHN